MIIIIQANSNRSRLMSKWFVDVINMKTGCSGMKTLTKYFSVKWPSRKVKMFSKCIPGLSDLIKTEFDKITAQHSTKRLIRWNGPHLARVDLSLRRARVSVMSRKLHIFEYWYTFFFSFAPRWLPTDWLPRRSVLSQTLAAFFGSCGGGRLRLCSTHNWLLFGVRGGLYDA